MKDSQLSQFNTSVKSGEGNITIVLFHSEWLPENACKDLLESYDAIQSNFVGQPVKFLQFSVNNEPHLTKSLDLKAVPAICSFNGDTFIDLKYGFMRAELLKKFTEQAITGEEDDEF